MRTVLGNSTPRNGYRTLMSIMTIDKRKKKNEYDPQYYYYNKMYVLYLRRHAGSTIVVRMFLCVRAQSFDINRWISKYGNIS